MSTSSSFKLLAIISIASFIAFNGVGATNSNTLYDVLKSHWRTLADWEFPKDAFNVKGEEEILWANLYQIGVSVVALCLAQYNDAKPTMIAAMIFFILFGIFHITAHTTLHPWLYLPLHYR